MAIKFRNGKHHRNPSGFYNKVKYHLIKNKNTHNIIELGIYILFFP